MTSDIDSFTSITHHLIEDAHRIQRRSRRIDEWNKRVWVWREYLLSKSIETSFPKTAEKLIRHVKTCQCYLNLKKKIYNRHIFVLKCLNWNFQGLSRFERQDRANDLLVFLAAQMTEDQKEPALYHLEELVTECLFAGNTCDPLVFLNSGLLQLSPSVLILELHWRLRGMFFATNGDLYWKLSFRDLIEEVSDPVYGRCFVYRGANQTITRYLNLKNSQKSN